MAFDPVYVRERDSYSFGDLTRLLGLDVRDALACVRALAARGVLTLRSDAAPRGATPTRSSPPSASTSSRGLASRAGARPSSAPTRNTSPGGRAPRRRSSPRCFAYCARAPAGFLASAPRCRTPDEDGGPLSLMLALLGSYEENGVYSNYVRVVRDNGSGEIAWGRTIAQNQPFMDGDTPVYFDLKTRDTSRDAARPGDTPPPVRADSLLRGPASLGPGRAAGARPGRPLRRGTGGPG